MESKDISRAQPVTMIAKLRAARRPSGGDMEKQKPLQYFYALYDNEGKFFSIWKTRAEAEADAVGPRFCPKFTIRQYELVTRKREDHRHQSWKK